MPYVDLPSARLAYSDDGFGDPPLVLLHAWTGDANDWIWQLPFFAAQHRVVALDLPGFGHSSPVADYSLPALSRLMSELIDRLGLRRPVVIGHSWGGAIACRLASDRPELMRAVVSIDGGYRMAEEWRPRVSALLAQLQGPDAHAVIRNAFAARWHAESTPPHLRAWHLRRIDGVAADVLHRSLAALAGGDGAMLFRPLAEPVLEAVHCPVLAFRTTAEEAAWERSHLRNPACRVELFSHTGHWLQQERPRRFNTTVLKWLSGLAS